MTAKTTAAVSNSGTRPTTSDQVPAGNLRKTPVMVEDATTSPTIGADAPSSRASSGSSGERHIA